MTQRARCSWPWQRACFECTPKPAAKSHPICTLRDTPDKPIHCIVYATDLLFPRRGGHPGFRVYGLDPKP